MNEAESSRFESSIVCVELIAKGWNCSNHLTFLFVGFTITTNAAD